MQKKLAGLVRAGVTRIINLMETKEVSWNGQPFVDYTVAVRELGRRAGREIHCQRFPIADVSVPTGELMREIMETIRHEVTTGGVVYVHCWGGKGRTAVVVGCYLIEATDSNGSQALEKIQTLTDHARESFGRTPQTDEQCKFVRLWQRSPMKDTIVKDRFYGALMGLAVGDAVGTTLEFQRPGSFTPIDDLIGGGPFALKPGEWTDDTSMALCLATSLVEQRGFDPRDQMERYVRWWKEGYLSVKDHCFDIGITVSSALRRFEADGNPYAGPTDPDTAGNGSIMRLAPVPLFYARDAQAAIERAGESSRTTHGTQTAVDACRFMAGLIVGAVNGATREQLLSSRYSPVGGQWEETPLHPLIAEIAAGSYKSRQPPEIRGTGYVVASLEAALWAFYSTDNFRDGCLKAANLGEDADTTAAVYGQIAGAFYGESGIPIEWRGKMAQRGLIADLTERLYRGRE